MLFSFYFGLNLFLVFLPRVCESYVVVSGPLKVYFDIVSGLFKVNRQP